MDKEISEWDSSIYEKIGVSFELPNHYPTLTAGENLDYFRTLYNRECYSSKEVLKMVGLEDEIDKQVKNYSKGMKIRLNVARSILHKPEILFLDEPTSGLDPVNARMIKDLILALRDHGATIFITTHNMSVADELCDNVAFITAGKLRIMDKPVTLKKSYGKREVVVLCSKNQESFDKTFSLEDLASNASFIKFLGTGDRIESIHSQETTLEDVFIQVTGEELG